MGRLKRLRQYNGRLKRLRPMKHEREPVVLSPSVLHSPRMLECVQVRAEVAASVTAGKGWPGCLPIKVRVFGLWRDSDCTGVHAALCCPIRGGSRNIESLPRS